MPGVLVALADTHADGPPALPSHLCDAVGAADRLLHAGDFTAPATVDGFADLAPLAAVHGNADDRAVRDRLPAVRVVEAVGLRVLLLHGHDHDRTRLSLLARQEEVDLAVVGHTHRPGVEWVGDLPVLNPGSHADPRGGTPAYATLTAAVNGGGGDAGDGTVWVGDGAGAVRVELRTPGGDPVAV